MIVLGLISGTSLDAIDVAAAHFERQGDMLVMQPLGAAELPWPIATRQRLLAALPPAATSVAEICALDVLVGEAFAVAAVAAIKDFAGHATALVCSHGQTVFHWVKGGRAQGTLQLGQPALIAEATGLPVISDLRARDVAAGGQGAPLASTLDALWLAGAGGPRAALNLGGIANITVVAGAGEPVRAWDTGPASCLLDVAAGQLAGLPYDRDGELASAGTVRDDLLARLLAEPYYRLPAPKSTGRELFHTGYAAAHCQGLPALSGPDLMATLTELTARTVARACHGAGVREVVASGGGVRNPALLAALRRALAPVPLVTSAARGLPPEAKEAYLFALLGWLSWHGLPGTVPGGTGGLAGRILGVVSPGLGPLVMPAPGKPIGRLVIQACAPPG